MPATREISPQNLNSTGLQAPPERTWQQDFSGVIRNVSDLLERLGLTLAQMQAYQPLSNEFPVLVTESFVRRMEPGNPFDPLLLQILPVKNELQTITGFTSDPVGDDQAKTAPGMLQKYHGRALLIAQGNCAINCRYCFRRHFPYASEPKSEADWEPALQAIENDLSLSEVILSGGDPLMMSDRRLKFLMDRFAKIPHLQRIRIHSRLPIVLPSRATEELCQILTSTRLQCIFVVHSNHAQELVDDCERAIRRIRSFGIPILNQAVLLRQINDNVEALAALCERCVNLGVMPYYLHQLDRVQGAAHFEVSASKGRELILALQARLPGYAVPKYVSEIAGETSKTPLL